MLKEEREELGGGFENNKKKSVSKYTRLPANLSSICKPEK
jgi:hypothetical protein